MVFFRHQLLLESSRTSALIFKLVLALSILPTFAAAQSKPETVTYKAVATNDKGKLAYNEQHLVTFENGKIQKSHTDYIGANGKVIATLISDYSKGVALPVYEFHDLRSGHREGIRFQDGGFLVYFSEPKKAEKSAPIKETKDVFAGQGWNYYLVDHLADIEKQDLQLKLILPSELDSYTFKVSKIKSNNEIIEARLGLNNWLLRLIAPNLRLVYNKAQKRLMEYEGVSNVVDDDGKKQTVTIRYTY